MPLTKHIPRIIPPLQHPQPLQIDTIRIPRLDPIRLDIKIPAHRPLFPPAIPIRPPNLLTQNAIKRPHLPIQRRIAPAKRRHGVKVVPAVRIRGGPERHGPDLVRGEELDGKDRRAHARVRVAKGPEEMRRGEEGGEGERHGDVAGAHEAADAVREDGVEERIHLGYRHHLCVIRDRFDGEQLREIFLGLPFRTVEAWNRRDAVCLSIRPIPNPNGQAMSLSVLIPLIVLIRNGNQLRELIFRKSKRSTPHETLFVHPRNEPRDDAKLSTGTADGPE